jgi:hypothetical protein
MSQPTRKNIALTIIIFGLFIIAACSKEDKDDPPITDPPGYSKGVFIVNEGPFQSGTGTITFVDRFDAGVEQKVFQLANDGAVLGNVVQSMNHNALASEYAFIAVNNANKIDVVDIKTFEKVRTIANVPSPRYVEFGENNKMYVSCWDNTVKIYTLDDTEYFGQLETGEGPEKMLKIGSSIWVLNQGGFSTDSTITIISTETDQVLHTLDVYPKPTGIQVDQYNHVWVLCSGMGWNGFPSPGDSEGHLVCIDPGDYSVIKDLAFPSTEAHPEKLVIDESGSYLFYNHLDGIYKFDVHSPELEEEPFIPRPAMFYGLGLDREEDILYASDPLDYVQQGRVYRYNAITGMLIDSLQAGIIPGEFYFTRLLAGK